MNKNLYRVVFSRARGLFVVVAEMVTGQHKTSAQSPASGPGQRVVTLRPIGLALLAAFGGIAPVHGQIIADPGAPKNQQPAIVNTANGTPQVNIRTPSAAGVSRNTYSQFDVNQQGAILNNARTSAQTRLGGWVQANPWLARGTAKVILNEVNGSHPSQLRGYIEVAGDRAQVVIANPAGISCDGCGFINANRATLTTGQPILNGGHLDGYRVQQGVINIGGAGLDASKTDFTDIIARAVNVNAGIWASTLKVSAGVNQVDAAHEQVRATAATGTAPGYAIDVASLGGMYAGKILLVGTEHGVGVRNAGEIGAGVGDVTLTAAGLLENRGRITAAGTVGVDSDAGIVNHGTVYAQGDSRLSTRGDIDNRGSLASVGNTTLIAAGAGSRIDNRSGALLAAGLGADGRVGSSGALQLNASGQIAAAGQQLAGGRLALEGSDVDLTGSQTHGGSVVLTARRGDLDASGATLSARQTLDARATGLLRSDRASVSAGQLTLAAYQQSNLGGELLQLGTGIASLTVTDRFDNTGGTVAGNGGITLQASQLLNRDGLIQAAGEGGLSLGIAGLADNQNGRIRAAQRLELAATGITNRNGVLAGADIHLDSRQQQFDNGNGIVAARGTLDLDSGRLDNAAGTLQADGALRINTHGQTLSNTGSGSQGGILGQHDVRLDTGELDNRSGFIGAVGDLAISADQVDNHASLLRAGGDVTVSAASIRNADTLGSDQGIEGRSVSINAHDIDNRAGAMRADQALTLTGAGHLDNQNGLLSSGQTVAVRDQTPGSRSQTVSNDGGTLIAGRQLSIDSAGLDGNGKLLSQGDLSLSLSGDYTQTGTLQAAGNATLTFGGTLSNQARLEAGSTLTVSAASLDNSASGSLRGDRTRLSVSDTLSNRGLIDGRETLLQADTIANIGSGRIYGDQLSIGATTLRNDTENGASASVAARDRLDLGVHTLVNREHALLFSAGDLAIGGALGSDGRATGTADHVGNHSASIEALNGLSLNANRVENSNEHFRIEEQQVGGPTRITEYQGSGAIARYLAGTPGVYPFKDESWQLRTPEGRYEGWLQYDYTRTVKESRVVESDPGRITAGGDLVLNADSVLNSNSRIMAGGALQASVRDLNNTEVVGKQTVTESGTVTSYWRHHKSGTDGTKSAVDDYAPATQIYDIRLTPTVYLAGTAPDGSGTRVAALALGSIGDSVSGPNGTAINPGQSAIIAEVKSVDGSVRTGQVDAHLPAGSLFRPVPDPSARYLVETDPAFANYRTWISSDYLFDQLRTAPSSVQKRLGDGFYEQKLVREQVAQLTGRRFLNGYASDEAQYRALLDNAVTYASKWDLRPGVALTPEQMARLTSDIVWLVEQDVTLPDGRTTRALVPQVYVQVRNGDLDGSGALIAGSSLKLDLSGDLNNMGTLAGRDIVSLSAENLKNLGGRITGSHVDVRARTDLDNIGGTIDAGKQLSAIAGRDLNLITTTRSNSNEQSSVTHVARVAGLYVTDTSAGLLSASAGRDVSIVGAQIDNRSDKGLTVVDAGRDLNLGTVATSRRQSLDWGSGNWRKDGSDEEVGSTLQVAGDIRLSASRDLNARAATVTSSDGAVAAVAGRDVNLTAGSARNFVDEAHRHTGSNGMLSKKTITTRDSVDETVALGTTFSGKTTQVQAGRDLLVDGSNVVSDKGTALVAGRDVRLQSATDTTIESHLRDEKKSGLFSSGGIGFTIGTQQQTADRRATSTRAAASTVGATEGNVAIVAGETYSQTGSKVVAPHGDIGIDARRVDIVEAREDSHSTYETRFKQTGLTVALTAPILSAIETAQQMKRAASQVSDGRLQALAGATTALAGKNAYDSVMADPKAAGGVSISITVGQSKSASLQTQDSSQGAASTVAAGGNIGIRASSAGKDSNLTVRGSDIHADGKVQLLADNDIALLAGKDTASQKSTNSSSSAGVGVAISVGSNGMAIGITANASAARGKADGSDVNWRNSHVTAGDTLIMQSGGDTTLRGAVVSGRQVLADIGGDLSIESLQDTSKYKSKNQSIGGSVTVGVGFSGSASYAKSKVDGDFASVREQSGIQAGDSGFDVKVKGNTDLKGSVIASTDKAVQDGLNRLTTGTLTVSDIENRSEYKATGVSLSGGFSVSGSGKKADDKKTDSSEVARGPEGPKATNVAGKGSEWSLQNFGNSVGAGAPGYSKVSGSDSSTTQSGISNGTLLISNSDAQREKTGQTADQFLANLNREVLTGAAANGLKKNWDAEKLRQQVEAQAEIVAAFSQQANQVISSYAEEKRAALREEIKKSTDEKQQQTLQDQINELNSQERVMNVIVGALTGTGGIAAVQASLSEAADRMRQYTIADSKKFPGITDGEITLDNKSGTSEGIRGDGFKTAGTRVVLDILCGADNSRCVVEKDHNGNKILDEKGIPKLDMSKGVVLFDSAKVGMNLTQFLTTEDGKKMAGLTGGNQSGPGTLGRWSYSPGSILDLVHEAYGGSHDHIGGSLSGYYDKDGNAKRGLTPAEQRFYGIWSGAAILLATPFALSEALPPQAWQAIDILLKLKR